MNDSMAPAMFSTTNPGPTSADGGSGDEGVGEPVRREALLQLLSLLRASDYSFITPTPATHARVVARESRKYAGSVRDVLGWSLPFAPDLLPRELLDVLLKAGAVLQKDDGLLAATIRVSSVRGALFVHSAYPTTGRDSVFLGPDSYRFADLIIARMKPLGPDARILDYGAGAGVGGIVAASASPGAKLSLADINPKALFLASINAEFAGLDYETKEASRPLDLEGEYDLIVTHPPFMMDRDGRAYRDGGGLFGGQLSLDWTVESMARLRPGGQLILHTGVSIVDGEDVLLNALRKRVPAAGWRLDYHELDPDIFGDELEHRAYAEVERIAAVGMVLERLT
jgi:methylase of polypeptide subunit release factors